MSETKPVRLAATIAALCCVSLAPLGCGEPTAKSADKSKKPATVTPLPDEANLATVALSESADKRLGIALATVERRPTPRQRTFGGVLEIPPGRTVMVSAPVMGTLAAPDDGKTPAPGEKLAAGQTVFILKPMLTPERYVPTPAERAQMANATATLAAARSIAEGDADAAKTEVDAAKIAKRRAEQLLRDRAGSRRAVDEAEAALKLAEAKYEAARERKTTLDDLALPDGDRKIDAIPIRVPEAGVLRNLSVARGEVVNMGEQLFEVAAMDVLWVRVPVYVGLVEELQTKAEARVRVLGERSTSTPEPTTTGDPHSDAASGRSESNRRTHIVKPAPAPPSADALSSTADLYYRFDNANGAFRPGERVSVTIPLRGETESLVVPSKSILYDVHGGTWVYAKTGEFEYRRSRVELKHVVHDPAGDVAVLGRGPDPGTEVVTDGAAELFGTEFGVGK